MVLQVLVFPHTSRFLDAVLINGTAADSDIPSRDIIIMVLFED